MHHVPHPPFNPSLISILKGRRTVLNNCEISEDCGSPYFEGFELSRIFFPLHIYFCNSSVWRPNFTKVNQQFYIFSLPFKDCFNSTVRGVSNPTFNVPFHGLVTGFHPKEDSLDSPAHEDMGSNIHVFSSTRSNLHNSLANGLKRSKGWTKLIS